MVKPYVKILGDVMQRHFIEAIIKEKINPVGAPTFSPIDVEEGQDLIFKASFEVFPEITLKDLEKIAVEKPTAEVKDEDVAEMLETLRKQQATWKEVDANAETTSRVVMDFNGTIDGEAFEGGKAENFSLAMGQNRMIPGFEDGILGKKAGEEFTIDVSFPDDYHAENLKGKAAQFAVTLHKVEAQELPELTEEFISRFGIEEPTVDGLKAEVRKNMERELKQMIKNRIKEQIIDGLVETNTFDVPAAIVDQEIDVLRQQAAQRFGGDMKNAPELPRELFEEQARRRVMVGLLLGEVIKSEELKADEARVIALITEMSTAYEDPNEVIEYYQKDQRLMENMRNIALEEQAIEAVLEKAIVSQKEHKFTELMNPVQG